MTVFDRIREVLAEIRTADGFPIRNAAQWSVAAGFKNPRWLTATLGKSNAKSIRPHNIEALANAIGLSAVWLTFGSGPKWEGTPPTAKVEAPKRIDPIRLLLARCDYEPARLAAVDFLARVGESPNAIAVATLTLTANQKGERASRETLLARQLKMLEDMTIGDEFSS